MDAFIGVILPFVGDYSPEDWHLCDGALLPVNQYHALFSIIGTKYGGDGVNKFALPNLQGRIIVGYGVSPDSGKSYPMGTRGGAETVQLGVTNLPSHNHAAVFTGSDSSGTITGGSISNGTCNVTVTLPNNATTSAATSNSPANGQYFGQVGTSMSGTKIYSNTTTPNVRLGQESVTASGTVSGSVNGNVSFIPTGTVAVGNTGLGQASSVMQPYQVLNYIICINGIYPIKP